MNIYRWDENERKLFGATMSTKHVEKMVCFWLSRFRQKRNEKDFGMFIVTGWPTVAQWFGELGTTVEDGGSRLTIKS